VEQALDATCKRSLQPNAVSSPLLSLPPSLVLTIDSILLFPFCERRPSGTSSTISCGVNFPPSSPLLSDKRSLKLHNFSPPPPSAGCFSILPPPPPRIFCVYVCLSYIVFVGTFFFFCFCVRRIPSSLPLRLFP